LSWGMSREHTRRTAELFAAEVVPAFADLAVRS
jgi:hypothetical protein